MKTADHVLVSMGHVRTRMAVLMVAALAFLAGCAGAAKPTPTEAPAVYGFYEIRVYTPAEGKAGALETRLKTTEFALYRKHGMSPIAAFRPAAIPTQQGDNRLFYLLGYPSREARDAAWKALGADPAWGEAIRTSETGGRLISKIDFSLLGPAGYGPVLDTRPAATPRTFELRTYKAMPGKLEAIHARFRDHTINIFTTHGMTNMAYWRPSPGQAALDGKMVYLLAFPGVDARNEAWRDFAADPVWQKVAADSQKDGALLDGRPESVILTPLDTSPLK
jgi:hypothetical protein